MSIVSGEVALRLPRTFSLRLIHRMMREHSRKIPCYGGRFNPVLTEDGSALLRERSVAGRLIVAGAALNCSILHHECYLLTYIFFNPRLSPVLPDECLILLPR